MLTVRHCSFRMRRPMNARTCVAYGASSIRRCLHEVRQETKRETKSIETTCSVVGVFRVDLVRICTLLEHPPLALRGHDETHDRWQGEIVVQDRLAPMRIVMGKIDEDTKCRLDTLAC